MHLLRRWVRTAILMFLVAARLAPATPAFAAESIPRFQVGEWQGFEFYEGGTAKSCMARRDYGGTKVVMRLLTNGEFGISVADAAWDFMALDIYSITVRVDGFLERSVMATGLGPVLVMLFGRDESLFEALRKGRVLYVIGQSGALEFDLDKSSAALEKLRSCALGDGSLAGTRNHPFGNPTEPNPLKELPRSAAQWNEFDLLRPIRQVRVEQLLWSGGFGDVRFELSGVVKRATADLGMGWHDSSGELIGALIVMPRLQSAPEELTNGTMEKLLGAQGKICSTGSAKLDRVMESISGRFDTHVSRVKVRCEAEGFGSEAMDVLLYVLPQKVIVVMHQALTAQASARMTAIHNRTANAMRSESP